MTSEITIFARGYTSSFSSSRSYSSSGSRSYSSTRSSYSAPRTSSTYRSTTTSRSSSSGSGYRSTRTSTSSKTSSHYTSTRYSSSTRITKSNLYSVTTPQYRTTVYHTYYYDHYWYNGFFHPFGWGYGGGDFWFYMWLFDHNQYNQQQQVLQASNTANVQPQSSVWGDVFGFVALVAVVVAFYTAWRWIHRHLIYTR